MRITICGIPELGAHCAAGITHVLSILDPGWPDPQTLEARTIAATCGPVRLRSVYVPNGGKPRVIGHLQQSADELKAIIKPNDWNAVHLIARGNTIIQILNGSVTSIVVDDDTANRALGGLIGFQMHVGPPMRGEFRNIWLKKLTS